MSVLGLQLHTALLYVHETIVQNQICTTYHFFQIFHLHNMQNGVTVDRKKCFIFVCTSGRRYILHNITLAYEHLWKKQVMTPFIVHTYIDWFLPLQMFERHILMVRKIVLLFCTFCIIFYCCSTQPWFKSYLQIQKKIHLIFH